MRTLLTCLLLAISLPASAQMYSYTDANGNKVYTWATAGPVSSSRLNSNARMD